MSSLIAARTGSLWAFERLSRMMTSYPACINRTVVCAPIYPSPPVIRIFLFSIGKRRDKKML